MLRNIKLLFEFTYDGNQIHRIPIKLEKYSIGAMKQFFAGGEAKIVIDDKDTKVTYEKDPIGNGEFLSLCLKACACFCRKNTLLQKIKCRSLFLGHNWPKLNGFYLSKENVVQLNELYRIIPKMPRSNIPIPSYSDLKLIYPDFRL